MKKVSKLKFFFHRIKFRKIYKKLPKNFLTIYPAAVALHSYVKSMEKEIADEMKKFNEKDKNDKS